MNEYMRSNGLLLAEEIRQRTAASSRSGSEADVSGTPFDRQIQKILLADPLLLAQQGRQWRKIPKAHPLCDSYFDSPSKGPMGRTPDSNVFDLDMLEFCGRVAVVFSNLNTSWYRGTPADAERRRSPHRGLVRDPGGVFAMAQQAMGGPRH